jgi:succinate dehydrogenase / fumarate reductase, cytochrome b subunit
MQADPAPPSTAVSSKRARRANWPPPGRGLLAWTTGVLGSSVGMKILVALTGLALTGFVIAHLAGNLAIFKGRAALNNYAAFLKDQGPLLWAARLGLLVVFALHIWLTIRLRQRAVAARPIPYSYHQSIQASPAARYMIVTGLVIFLFTVFHIAHYTLGSVTSAQVSAGQYVNYLDLRDEHGHQDVYRMTWYGFHDSAVAVLYIVAQLALILHLSHGVGSTLQTLGLNTPRTQPVIRAVSWGVALLVGLGNILIVVAVWSSLIAPPPNLVP